MIRSRPALALAMWLSPALARADEIASDEDVCRGRELGAACSVDAVSGSCRETTCAGLDYSGGHPKAVQRPCRRCMAGEPEPITTKAEPATVPASTPRAEASSPSSSGCALDRGAASWLGLGVVLLALARRRTTR